MIVTREQLKAWFRKGMYPLESQFAAWIDSFVHKADKIAMSMITGLSDALNNKADVQHSHAATQITGLDEKLDAFGDSLKGLSDIAYIRPYTLDFTTSGELVQDTNLMGDIVINKLLLRNVAQLFVTYTGVTRQMIDLTQATVVQQKTDHTVKALEIELNISDLETIDWEIVREVEEKLACVGVRYEIQTTNTIEQND